SFGVLPRMAGIHAARARPVRLSGAVLLPRLVRDVVPVAILMQERGDAGRGYGVSRRCHAPANGGDDSVPFRNTEIYGNLRNYFLRVPCISMSASRTVSSLTLFSLNSDSLLIRIVNAAMLTPFGRLPCGE